MRALILGGAGAVCKETTRDLALYSSFEEIVVADQDLEAVRQLIDEAGDSRLVPLAFDARDEARMNILFPDFDIIVNGLPYRFDLAVNRACVATGVSGLDLSSDDPQFALNERAVAKNMIFIPGVGATPGITNMMARRAADRLDTVESLEVSFAAFRCLAPSPGLLQTTLWEFNPSEPERRHVYYEDGQWHPALPLSGGKAVNFHEQIGEQMAYLVPHDEAYSFPKSFSGLRRAAVRGCFPPHVMELMSAFSRAGLLSNRPVNIGETQLASIEMVRKLLLEAPFSRENPVWAYGLVVEATGTRADNVQKITLRSQHPPQETWGGASAYYKNVGVPLSIGAQLIASGRVEARGVVPPELALPVVPFFEQLARRGITIEESVSEIGVLP